MGNDWSKAWNCLTDNKNQITSDVMIDTQLMERSITDNE